MIKHKAQECYKGQIDCDDCYACHLAVCSVCGCYEGSLMTECPGEKLNFDKQQEIYENFSMDFTEEKGWHDAGHKSLWDREALFDPTFEELKTQKKAALPPKPEVKVVPHSTHIPESYPG